MKQGWRESIASRHQAAFDAGLWRTRKTLSSQQSVETIIDGRSVINFSSNDYLGLAAHESLKLSAEKACRDFGVGSGASHLVCGHHQLHHQLEFELAAFVGAQRAVLFSSGYMANLAMAATFLTKGDLLLQDKLNHASLIDSAKLSPSHSKRYAHCDVEHAEKLLRSVKFNRCMIATDSVFSMDGDIAPLRQLQLLASNQQALLLVDDAHGFGLMGATGQGALSSHGLSPVAEVLMMGTLGKALGCYGAFVAGDALYIEHLTQFARPYIYTTALPPSVSASVLAALAVLADEGDMLRARLNANISHFKRAALKRAVTLLPSSTAIQVVVIGDSSQAVKISSALFSQGINLTAIRPPTVARGSARLRVALSAAHTFCQIDRLIELLSQQLKQNSVELNDHG
jgi:8-amino-7-oxononanoate synthase